VRRISEYRAKFADTNTRVLRVEGDRPPLILLHGYSDSADTWRPMMGLLGDGEGAVAVDLPGFGRADRVNRGPLLPAIDRFVAALVREHAGEGPVVVVGNSLGGVAALRAAHDASLPLAGIVPISPAGLGHAPWVDMLAREPIIHRIVALPIPLPRTAVRRAAAVAYARLAVADRRRASREVLRNYASHIDSSADVRRIVAGSRTLLAELGAGYPSLASITCPVTMIWGDRDLLVPISGAQRVLESVPGSRLERLDGVGHCAQVEAPELVHAIVSEFVARCRASAATAA
jgi:pimeloyl-ACP methyl ester carboxylesterase